MTDEKTPATETSTETAGAATAPRRRRRATSPAGEPTATTTEAGAATGAADQGPAEKTPVEKAPRAARASRSTKAAKAVAADEPASVEKPARAPRQTKATKAAKDATAGAAPSESAAPEETTSAAPRRRRRATSPAAPPAAEQVTIEQATDAQVEETPAAAPQAEEPAPRSRRSRSGATRSRRSGATTVPEPAPEPQDETEEEDETAADAVPVLDVLAELGAPVQAEPSTQDRPRLATTAVLFQTPDASDRPRRRRAQAPAGPPQDAATEAEDEAAEPAATDESTGSSESTAARPSRSRSGRRRGRAGAAAEADATLDEATPAPAGPETSRGADAGTADDAEKGEQDENDETAESGEAEEGGNARRRRRRGGRGRRRPAGGDDQEESDESSDAEGATDTATDDAEGSDATDGDSGDEDSSSSRRRRRRRSRSGRGEGSSEEPSRSRNRSARASDEVTALKGSTRLEAKRQRRREGRDAGRRRAIITEAEFLARREAVDRSMVVKEANGRVQIAVLEDGVLVEHFVSRSAQNGQSSMSGNVYLGRVQNVLPSMEAAFVDIGKGRNAVLYAGEVNWDAAGMEGQPRRIEQALKSGDSVLVQVTKDPIGHKGARLTSQITLAGRYLVYVPGGGMTGISRKLPENERARLKKLLKEIVPEAAGVIVRTAAEGASEDELRRDVQRLQDQWAAIEKKSKSGQAPVMLQGEPDLAIRVVRDIFNDDFGSLVVQGEGAWSMISEYVQAMAPDLADKVSKWTGTGDVFSAHRVDEQLAKGMDRKVWLPSGGSLVIDRTEAMTVVDVNTGKFTGSGGTLEETVTRNNLEAAEEIVRQLRLRDIGGIIVIDFIDMVLESNRDLVLRRLVECLGRDRTKHQVAEVTSLGLVQMTRKRVGQGLVEAFSETCQHCAGRGFIVHTEPIDARPSEQADAGDGDGSGGSGESKRSRRRKGSAPAAPAPTVPVLPEARDAVKATLATIAAAAAHAHDHDHDHDGEPATVPDVAPEAPEAASDAPDGGEEAPSEA